MTSRREDELDLTAMSIADMVKNSDNLRIPRNPEWALKEMLRWLQPQRQEDVA
ncbi:MAG: hypothetical protein NXH88_10075 [Hyphomonas sp.]|nr:hypothetical protein [Hyphomonas sp.]